MQFIIVYVYKQIFAVIAFFVATSMIVEAKPKPHWYGGWGGGYGGKNL